MLGATNFRIDRQRNVLSLGSGEIVPRYLAAAVGSGLDKLGTPFEAQIIECRFFLYLPNGCIDRRLSGLDHAFREIPVAECAQQQEMYQLIFTSEYHCSGRKTKSRI
jgi:hypothetical protein